VKKSSFHRPHASLLPPLAAVLRPRRGPLLHACTAVRWAGLWQQEGGRQVTVIGLLC
jgi:hypothetical protein